MPKSSRKITQCSAERFSLEALEPRVLFSADAVSLVTGALFDAAQSSNQSSHVTPLNSAARAETQVQDSQAETHAVELVIVDRSVEGADWIASQLQEDSDANRVIVFLDANKDGLDQISAILDAHESVGTVHLFSHGEDAQLLLGSTLFDEQTLLVRAEQISSWSAQLTSEADLLIYGCDLAGSTAGREFATVLGQLMCVDIAASDNLTGNAVLGGDWQLEYRSGSVESDATLGARVLNDYAGSLAIYTVDNTGDSTSAGSLRWAITQANDNAASGPHTIDFSVTGTISPTSALPTIISQISLDGAATIVLDGTSAGSTADGLKLGAGSDGSVIEGIEITLFAGSAIHIESTSNVSIYSVNIGDVGTISNDTHGVAIVNSSGVNIGDGSVALQNVINSSGEDGILITGTGSTGNTIDYNTIKWNGLLGGTSYSGVRIEAGASNNTVTNNQISDNTGSGITMNGASTTDNVIDGNSIGTNKAGTAASANSEFGVLVSTGASDNAIGIAGSGNVISSNGAGGISIKDVWTTGNSVVANVIGTATNGTAALANGGDGIFIQNDAKNNIVGGSLTSERNIISGNTGNGITIRGADSNDVFGNHIGTDITGTIALPNTQAGVQLEFGSNANKIGGLGVDDGNLISGNTTSGLIIRDTNTIANLVYNNHIGTSLSGTTAIPNQDYGVYIFSSAKINIIGGPESNARNLISGNQEDGVFISGFGTDFNRVVGNFIGLEVSGTAAMSNGNAGVLIADGSKSSTIGGAVSNEGNVISGNTGNGIEIKGSGTNTSQIVGNYIGTKANGLEALPNGENGIEISQTANSHQIGSSVAGGHNVISGNTAAGVLVNGSSANVLHGNRIGTDSSGTSAVGNGESGVVLKNGSLVNVIGGDQDVGEGNLISGNTQAGVYISDVSTAFNALGGNIIGLDVTGTLNLGNGSDGIWIGNSAAFTQIGADSTAGFGNTISGNGGAGISINGAGTDVNVILGNQVGTNLSGTGALGNTGHGIEILGGNGTRIGNTGVGHGNLIAANGGSGIYIEGTIANNTIVEANILGSDDPAHPALGNTEYGVHVLQGATGTTIGSDRASGNLISGNTLYGIAIDGAGTTGTVISGNTIGTDSAGTTANANQAGGIWLTNNSSATQIGGNTTNDDYNLISGNAGHGILIDAGSTLNDVHGNTIGLSLIGLTALSNTGSGLQISSGSNTIGTGTSAGRNTISGNKQHGIYILSGSSSNVVQGNFIGLDVPGTGAVANEANGLLIESNDNLIGGTTAGQGNSVANNLSNGILVSGGAAVDNAILGNSIQDNAGLGIDIGTTGVSANDADDTDAGSNRTQNFPVLTNADTDESSEVTVTGSLNSTANTDYRIEFFASSSADGSGYGEGSQYLGFIEETSDGSGNLAIFETLSANVAVGEYVTATATVVNGASDYGDTSEFSAYVQVILEDRAPTFTSTQITSATEDAAYTYNIIASDENPGDTLGITAGTLPSWLTLTDNGDGTATLSGTPVNAEVGDHSVVLVVTDNTSLSSTQSFTITVANSNDAPVIDSGAAFSVVENNTGVGTITSTDDDITNGTGDTVTYSIVAGNDSGLFSINATSGALSFVSAPDFETPGDIGTDNIYDLTVQVTDGSSAVDTQAITVTVTDTADEDLAPINDSDVSADTVDENSAIGTTVGITAQTTDGDAGQSIVYSLDSDAGGLFAIHSSTGVVTVAGALNHEAASSHSIDVRATSSDGSEATRRFTIAVEDVNEAPVFTFTRVTSATEDTVYTYNVITSDVDSGDTLSITASTLPTWLTLTDNGDGTATLSGTPDNAEVGDHAVVLVVTDSGSLSDTQSFTLSVANSNDAPVIDSGATFSVVENTATVGTITSTDVDEADRPAYSIISGNDAGLFEIDSSTGTLRFTSSPDFENPADGNQNNEYRLVVQVSDGTQATTQQIAVIVDNVNEAPILQTTKVSTVNGFAGSVTKLNILDPDSGDTVEVQVVGGSAQDFFVVDSQTQELSQKQAISAGSYTLEITLVDLQGETSTAVLEIFVRDDGEGNEPLPEIGQALPTESVTAYGADSGERFISSNKAFLSVAGLSVFNLDVDSESVSPETNESVKSNANETVDWRKAEVERLLGTELFTLKDVETPTSSQVNSPITDKQRLLKLLAGAERRSQLLSDIAIDVFELPAFRLTLSPGSQSGLGNASLDTNEGERDAQMQQELILAAGSGATVVITASLIVWLLNTGILLSAAASSSPLWRSFDPIPVLKEKEDNED